MHWCSYLACASHKSALYRPKFKADTSLYFLHRVPSWQFSVISLKSEKWIWVVVLWFKEITGFWAANYGRDRCTTGYRKTANHKLVIKMHTVRGSTASERNPVEMVKILKTEFGHSIQLRQENNGWNFHRSWGKKTGVFIKISLLDDGLFWRYFLPCFSAECCVF